MGNYEYFYIPQLNKNIIMLCLLFFNTVSTITFHWTSVSWKGELFLVILSCSCLFVCFLNKTSLFPHFCVCGRMSCVSKLSRLLWYLPMIWVQLKYWKCELWRSNLNLMCDSDIKQLVCDMEILVVFICLVCSILDRHHLDTHCCRWFSLRLSPFLLERGKDSQN